MVHEQASARAETVAGRLQSEAVRRASGVGTTAADEQEAEWSASTFVMRVLDIARLELPPWDRVAAEAALKNEEVKGGVVSPLADLEARCLVRVILGEVAIPWGVRITRHSDAQGAADQRALAVLTDSEQAEQRNNVWVGRTALSNILKSHQLAHQDTPTLDRLLLEQKFEKCALDGEPGFRIARGWGDCLARGAALLWHRWLRYPPPGLGSKATLLAWLRLTRGLTNCWDALAYMTATAKSIWLNTALELILEEADLIGWSNEGERRRRELDYPNQTQWEWAPPYDDPDNAATLVDRYLWLEEFEAKHKGLVFRDDARNELNDLITAIVRYDDDTDVAYVNRCARIQSLLQAGTIRPHLLRVIPFSLCQDRPSALAWLATKTETGSLALNLADRLTGVGTGWDSFPDRLLRSENYRTEIWKELFEIFLIVVRTLDNRALAKALDECLATLAIRTVEAKHYRPDVGAVHNAAAHARLDYALSALKGVTRSGWRQPTRGARFQDSFLALTAEHLLALWSDRCRKPPRPDFSTFPLAELHLLFWLLGEIQSAGENARWLPSAHSVTSVIAEAYVHEVTREGTGAREVYWLDDEPQVAALKWPLMSAGLNDLEYSHFIRPMNWNARIKEIITKLNGGEAMLAIKSWTRRARFHLRVLLSLHAAITSKPDEPRLASLEDAIGELLIVRDPLPTGEGTLGLFREWKPSHNSSSLDDDLPGLLVDELWRFSPDRRVATVASWAATTESLADLLAIAAALDLPREFRIIQGRLTEFNVDAYLANQHWFTLLEKMAQDAAVAKLRAISRKILDYGDRASHDRAYGENWRKSAFRTRLILAYEENDLGILDTLVPGPPPNDKLTDEMRRSREFYRALLLLNVDPAKAVNIFTELVNKNPLELTSRLNLIAAHIEHARILPSQHDRRAAALLQLDEIERLEQDLPPASIPRWRNNLSYNRLASCDLAEDDSRFDQFWAALAVRERHSISFLKLLHRNSRRRGNSTVFDAAWEAAQPHFANVDGSMWPEFASMREEQVTEPLVTPLGVEVFSFTPDEAQAPNSEIPKLPPHTPPRLAHRFLPGRPWSDRESLPGREEELARLGELVLARRPVVVLGQRRAGKTSLLRHLGRRLANERDVYYFALEGHRIRNKDDLALALSPEIVKDKEDVARATLVDPKISKRVYLIDELAHLSESDQTVFGWLRQLWHVSGGVVLAGTPWDWWRVHQHAARVVPGSSFGNDLTPEELGPLTYPNAIQFLVANRGEDSYLDEEAALRIIERCGTWPYYLNVMGEAVLRAGGKIDEAVVDLAYRTRLLRGASAVFSSRWAELPQAISNLLRDHRGMRPDFRQLGSLLRVQLLDAGLCNLAGEWLDDKPFYDWIQQYALEEEQ